MPFENDELVPPLLFKPLLVVWILFSSNMPDNNDWRFFIGKPPSVWLVLLSPCPKLAGASWFLLLWPCWKVGGWMKAPPETPPQDCAPIKFPLAQPPKDDERPLILLVLLSNLPIPPLFVLPSFESWNLKPLLPLDNCPNASLFLLLQHSQVPILSSS